MKKLTALCLLTLSPALALAGLLSPSTSISGSGAYTWTYGLQLAPLQKGKTDQPTEAGVVKFDRHRDASFFTVHDFAGYVDGSCAGPAGWTCSVEAAGGALDELLLDGEARTVDLTWSTTAPSLNPGRSIKWSLGDFSAQSIFGDAATVTYTAYTPANPGRWARSEVVSAGSTLAPAAGSTQGATAGDTLAPTVGSTPVSAANDMPGLAVNRVPEPGSLAMAGLGLVLAGFARRGRGRRQPA